MKLEGRHVVVVGMARSGAAAVELLIGKGARVRAVDEKGPGAGDRGPVEVLPQIDASFAGAELIVLSPGVPADAPAIERARQRGVRIIGDLELASWFLQGEIIGITGSNGKTTTTALTGHILKSSGIAAQVGGNIGTPPCSMVATSRADQWNVLELSSFQLETIETFRAHIGACLNITPDHLDRHYTLENYANAKARLFENQRAGDFKVLNQDDPICVKFAGRGAVETRWFSKDQLVNGNILFDGDPLMPCAEVPLRGLHNLENTMAAAAMAALAGATREQIRAAVKTFPGVEHRLEFVRNIGGVEWFNDSKATNVDATLKAIEAFSEQPGGLWIILGGKDKNSDYTPLAPLLKAKARAALLIGGAADKIEAQLAGSVEIVRCGTIDVAIRVAQERARSGDVVLLAPACASFDQFDNFEHRGRVFKQLVKEIQWRG